MIQRAKRRAWKQEQLIDLPPVGLHFFEDSLFSQGYRFVAGVDEAGRGCLAGPVVAAAVILPQYCDLPGLKDSKQLKAEQREFLYGIIREKAKSVGVGVIEPAEIDRTNILKASLKAMRQAVEGLKLKPEYLLIDGPFPIEHRLPQRAIKHGDARSFAIAAASIIAKVTRDRLMCEYERLYPSFRFSIHKGYGTALHYEELERFGPTPIHRRTFRGVVV